MKERILDLTENYVAPISAAVVVIVMMVLNAYMLGVKTHWTVGVMVMCFQVLGGVKMVSYISKAYERDNEES